MFLRFCAICSNSKLACYSSFLTETPSITTVNNLNKEVSLWSLYRVVCSSKSNVLWSSWWILSAWLDIESLGCSSFRKLLLTISAQLKFSLFREWKSKSWLNIVMISYFIADSLGSARSTHTQKCSPGCKGYMFPDQLWDYVKTPLTFPSATDWDESYQTKNTTPEY